MLRTPLAEAIEEGQIPPFVYCYPPRSTHRKAATYQSLDQLWSRDFDAFPGRDLNLYLHIPFCRYLCGYCNLYTTSHHTDSVRAGYVAALSSQIQSLTSVLQRRRIATLYIGGGTPALLKPAEIESILQTIDKIDPFWRSTVEEVCIESTPDSLSENPSLAKTLTDMGITRINMGVQSLDRNEIREAGRGQAGRAAVDNAIQSVREAGLANLSTDLIIGFNNQTDASFLRSVHRLLEYRPETISLYYLTIRPDAWFARTGEYSYQRAPRLYARYDAARELLLGAGYVQETNVRFKIPGRGGYRQKTLHFRGVPVLGLGAGARGYSSTTDYTLALDRRNTAQEIGSYITEVSNGRPIPMKTFDLDNEELIRKRLALDLFDLDIAELGQPGARASHQETYLPMLAEAVDLGLLNRMTTTRYTITPLGLKYRDILSWQFFSDRVRALDSQFYAQMHSTDHRVRRVMHEPPR